MPESFFTHDPIQETVLDVDVEMLARVYAKAALNAAGDHEAQQSLMDELKAIVTEVLVKYPELEKVFDSALVSQGEKLGIIRSRLREKYFPDCIEFSLCPHQAQSPGIAQASGAFGWRTLERTM